MRIQNVVGPVGKTDPLGGVEIAMGVPQLSVAVTVKVTTAPLDPASL